MKIKKFTTINMHGYLNLNVDFNDDLTFLTGINGSGKTSIVRGIVSLLKPSFKDLFNTKYDLIKVELEYKNKQISIYSKKRNGKIFLGCEGCDLKKNEVEVDISNFSKRAEVLLNKDFIEEYEEERYREEFLNKKSQQLIRCISNLPKPLTLGIERRVSELLPENIQRKLSPFSPSRYRRYGRDLLETFFGYIPQLSLENAIKLAEEKYNETQNEQKKYTEELRNNLVTQSVTIGKRDMDILEMKEKVNNTNITEIIDTITKLAGLEDKKIKTDLTKIYNKLQDYSKKLPDNREISFDGKDKKNRGILLDFILDQSQLDRILTVFDFVKIYNEKTRLINIPIDIYINTINEFLKDSNKNIYFDKSGKLRVRIKNIKDKSPSELASGEIQILTILTQIAFNKDLNRANIFIIDEPELSLHIKWQEIFVKTIMKLKPKLQMIVATHSPPIFSNYLDKCISLN